MPLFGKSSKSPVEVVKVLKESLTTLEKGGDGKKQEKAQEDTSKQLVNIKNMLFGTDSEQQSDIVLAQLSQEMYNSGLLLLLLRNLHKIDFEGKKDAAQIFNNILRRQIGTRTPTVEYICTKPEILFTLARGYEQQEIALNCGTMLRECVRYEALTKIILHSDHFYDFFHVFKVFVANPNKPKPILDILLRNQEKLVDFLSKFHTDRSEDEQFNDEKAYLIKQINELKPLPEGVS